MSLLRTLQNGTASRAMYSTAMLARMQSTQAPAQSAVEAAQKQASDISTSVPPKEAVTADIISGAPSELRYRTARIYQPTRNTMQSGGAKGTRWRLDFDILQGAGRWENPLMGWASSADYVQGTRVSFRSKEDAIHFAEKQGWDYYVQAETVKRVPPKNYSENFLYNPKQLRICRTK